MRRSLMTYIDCVGRSFLTARPGTKNRRTINTAIAAANSPIRDNQNDSEPTEEGSFGFRRLECTDLAHATVLPDSIILCRVMNDCEPRFGHGVVELPVRSKGAKQQCNEALQRPSPSLSPRDAWSCEAMGGERGFALSRFQAQLESQRVPLSPSRAYEC